MISADTSVWIDFFEGRETKEVLIFQRLLDETRLCISPPVLSEILSFPLFEEDDRILLQQLPRLEIKSGFWEKVGELRRSLLRKKLKAHPADCLIAQCCIDTDTPLLTSDKDFRHFEAFGLILTNSD